MRRVLGGGQDFLRALEDLCPDQRVGHDNGVQEVGCRGLESSPAVGTGRTGWPPVSDLQHQLLTFLSPDSPSGTLTPQPPSGHPARPLSIYLGV